MLVDVGVFHYDGPFSDSGFAPEVDIRVAVRNKEEGRLTSGRPT